MAELAHHHTSAVPVDRVVGGLLVNLSLKRGTDANVHGHPWLSPEGGVHPLKAKMLDEPRAAVKGSAIGIVRHGQPLCPPGFPRAQPVRPIWEAIHRLKAHCAPESFPTVHDGAAALQQ